MQTWLCRIINDLEDRTLKLLSQKEETEWKNLEELWNYEIMGCRQEKQYLHYDSFRRKRERTEMTFKVAMVENFPNLGREMDIQICEPQGTPKRVSLNRARLWHIIIKLLEVERIFENKRETLHIRGSP